MRKGLLTLIIFAATAFVAAAVSIPAKPDPQRLVNDFSGVFTDFQRDSLEAVLVSLDDSTSNQICVVVVPDLDGAEVAEYAIRLGNAWGVGSSKNNGVIVLLKSRTAEEPYIDVAIEVGRGLEGAIPDVYASRIIRNLMGPQLREDRYFKAVVLACDELAALAKGEISEPRDDENDDAEQLAAAIFILMMIIVIAIILVKNSEGGNGGNGGGGSGRRGPVIIIGSNPLGGSSFGGGSFGGGGGFGGFGGGSFGGGGATGRF